MTICAGGGYLRSEFRALGVDFEERGEAAETLAEFGQEVIGVARTTIGP